MKLIIWYFDEQAEEEARSLQKKIQSIENDLDQTQEALMQVNAKLEEKDKALQNVSTHQFINFLVLGITRSWWSLKELESASQVEDNLNRPS